MKFLNGTIIYRKVLYIYRKTKTEFTLHGSLMQSCIFVWVQCSKSQLGTIYKSLNIRSIMQFNACIHTQRNFTQVIISVHRHDVELSFPTQFKSMMVDSLNLCEKCWLFVNYLQVKIYCT